MSIRRGISVLALALGAGGAGFAAPPDPHLPQPMLEEIAVNPQGFLREASSIVLGYGGPDGLSAQGIADYIAITRARKRADVTATLMAADLNADGAVDAAEVETLAGQIGARARATLRAGFVAADPTGSGRIGAAEIATVAEKQAMRALTEAHAATLRGLMLLDADGNARLTAEELAKGILALGVPAQSGMRKGGIKVPAQTSAAHI
jgi:hypothetical protein